MHSIRKLALIVTSIAALCLFELHPARTQSSGPRRITNTTEEGININPSISGDGKIVAFESTEDVAGAGGSDHFRAIRANVAVDPATLYQMAGTRAVAPAISQDGSRIAFASKDDPLGTNSDGNSEIFLFDGAKLIQVTNTSPGDIANRVSKGNSQPSISDDGRFIAFSSNRDLAGQNSDGNLEIFVYDSVANTFAQLTTSSGTVGFSDAKISGNGVSIAYIRDAGATSSAQRDLLEQPRSGPGAAVVLAANVQSLQMTYGRAISDDGTRVVYSAETAADSSQVFLYDGRSGSAIRQITSLGARVTDVPLHPTISGDGTRIAFATRRAITGFSNSDNSIELYTYDTPTGQFARVTSAPAEADGFDGTSRATEVVSSLNDDGSMAAFNFPRALSGPVTAGLENRSEIYLTATAARPPFTALTAILNGASFGNEPAPIKAIAPDSIAVARGSALASSTLQSQRIANGNFPTNVGGTSVTVNGRAAQIFFISPGQVNFLVPPQTEIGNADVVVTNSDNFSSRGTVPTLRAAPGVFTKSGDGIGEGMILTSDTLQDGPFDPSSGNLRLTIFATGARNASQTLLLIGGRILNAESVIASPDMPGLDEVQVRVPADLRGAGNVNLSVQSDGRESNPVTLTFNGDPSRAVFINEVLADPPDGLAGDANHDGARDGTQDEFVELVNGTASDAISVGGWTVRTRATGGTTETTRFTFAAGTTLPAGEAIVVFGGGGANFEPNDGVFGCAQVVKATSSAGLALTNGGLTILIRDGAGNLITQFSFGGSTGLEGDNNQSLARSPDITGNFVQHASAAGANGLRFSPGLKANGTPFGNCPARLTSVMISPPSATTGVGETTQFTAQAFDQFGRSMNGVTINFASDNSLVAAIDSVSKNSTTGVETATVSGHNPGAAHITAAASEGSTTINSSQSTLTVTGPSLSINDVTLNEGNSGSTTFKFTVGLSQPAPTGGVKFDIATQDGSATSGNDYVARSLLAQTIPAGQLTYTFDVAVNGDVNIEPNETFFVNVANVSGASVGDGQGLGTIVNDDSPVLSINDVFANEGNSATSTFTFTVSSTLPAPAGGITFDITTTDSTANAAGGDYIARSLTGQTIPAGEQTCTFDVTVNGDTLVEPNETFFVNISNVSSNSAVSDSQGLGTIQNDDTALLVISQVFGGGDNSGAPFRNDFVEIYNRGTTIVDFGVTPYSVQYASVSSNFGSSRTNLTSGTIAPGGYFLVQEAGGTTNGVALPTPDASGTIAMGNTSGKVALVVGTTALQSATCPGDDGSSPFNHTNSLIADLVGYGNSATTAGHCYEGAGPAVAPSNATADFRKAGGCLDTNENAADFLVASPSPRNSSSPVGDCKPEITINDVTVTEGNSSTVNASFTVSLSAASAQIVTVNYATADATATAPADYQTTSGLLTFNPGDLSKTINVLVNGDTLDEPNETFFVNLSNAGNAVVLDSQGQGTINDNDAAPSLSINDLSIAEGDAGTTPFTFTVSLSAVSGQTVTVNYATADNTAAAGSDYQSTSGLLTFNPGDTSKPITVLVNGDSTFEPNETFFVNLTAPTNASINDSQGQGTITNDDAAPPIPTLSISDLPNIAEGDSGTSVATFTVTLSPSSSHTVKVDYVTANGSATAGSDYQSTSGTLTFDPGDISKQIMVTINGDKLVEPDETFTVNLSNATGGAAIGTTQATGTIKNDDIANLVISQVYGGGGNSGATFRNDFIEVFNRGTTTVDLAGWSVQETSATSTGSWSATQLCSVGHCLLSPGQYFLVQEASAGAIGSTLPTPDATGSIAMSATSGKVALVSNITPLSGACPVGTNIADRVGYGGTAATADFCFEGAGPAPAPGSTTADFRKAGGCTDTDDNAADFVTASPNPRNTASPLHDCNAPPTLTSVTISPALATIGVGDTQQFTGQALDQFGQPIGGVTVTFASNNPGIATVDSATPTSGTGSAAGTVSGQATGSAKIRASATNGSTNVTSSPATIAVEPAAGQVLISEFRTRGPGGAADEFIEIYNPTTSTVNIGGLVIRSSNSAGSLTKRATITAGVTLGPGCHYLFAPSSFSASGTVPPDQSFSSGITDDGGVAITRSDLVTIIDAVGMSSGSAYKESPTLAPLAGTSNQSYERKPGGAAGNGTDTNNNGSDFFLNSGASNPQNSSSGCVNTSSADLSITKTDSPDPITVGSDISYTIAITNNGIGAAQNAVVTDDLPLSLTFVSCASTGIGVCGGTGNNRTVTFATLAVGSSAAITIVATVNGTGGAGISNTATVSAATTDANTANNSATTTTAVSSADLSITKSDSADPVNANENITYTLTVTNNSSSTPAQSVTVSDQVPSHTTFVSVGVTPSGWTRSDSTMVGQTGTITYTRPTFQANGTALFTITVKVDSDAANNSTISNTATVTSNTPDDNSSNNSQTATTTVHTPADLSISKTVNDVSPNVGESIVFTITVSNPGPYAATSVSVKDQLPSGLTYVSDDGGGAYASSTGIWTIGTVNASGSAILHVNATAASASVSGVTNTAEVITSDQFDPDSTPNNQNGSEDDQAGVTVTAKGADLSLTKTVDNASPTVGQDVTFTVTLSNDGPNAATNVTVKDLLPAELTFVSSTQSQGSYSSLTGLWTVGTVNSSVSATLNITAAVQSAGTIVNTAEVTASDVFDPDSTPNNQNAGEDDQASRIIRSLLADLSLLKSVNNAAPNVGDNVVFTIIVSNAGPSPATNVQVTDQLPTGLTYLSDDGAGSYVSGTGIWTVGTVGASGTATLHITATATSASINGVTNTAEVTSSDVPDSDSTPNNQNASEDDQSSATVNAKDADVSVSKTVNNATPNVSSNIIFTVRLSNAGHDAATGVVVSDALPSGLSFLSATPSQGSYDSNTGLWTVGSLSVGIDTATLAITATVSTSGAKTNTAEVVASGVFDPDSTPNDHNAGQDDQSSVTITPQQVADLSLSKAVDKSTPNTGENVAFTIKLSNAGPNVAAGVQVKDLLPAGLQFVSASQSQGSYVNGTGIWSVGTVSVGTDSATLTITATVLTTGAKTNSTEVTASDMPDPDSTPNNNLASEDDQASVTVTGAANLIINEIVTSPPSSSAPADANDFVEIFNKSTASIDISGLIMSYRAGSLTTPSTFTLPGTVGSATTVIGANSYLIIANGTSAYGTLADFNASASGFDLTAASGGIKIELRGVKVDGLAYRNSASNTISATFAAFGEGTAFTSPVSGGLQDYIRSPNGADTNDNATNFRRNGTAASVTPKGPNPTIL